MQRAPKQWCLTKNESVNSFENWKQNLTYTLSLDTNFAPFLILGASWNKLSRDLPLRGFTDDANDVPVGDRRTAQQKCNMLHLMLGQIANYWPVISRNSIVKTSTSIESIWQCIRLHFGFQTTGAHFLDLADIRLGAEERPEDLYQRIVAFVEDSLLSGHGILHHGDMVTEEEEDVGYVDMWDSFVGNEELYFRDGLHLSGKGAAVLAEGLSGAVASGLGKVRYLN